MSEEEGKHFCVRNATPKHREIWRNIALLAWIMGLVPGLVAVVILTGTSMMFAFLVALNIIFLIVNCGFCCVHLQTLKKKRIFYTSCQLIMAIITVVMITAVVTVPQDDLQIVGFVGCGLTFLSCVAFLILNILLHIHGPGDPVSSDSNLRDVQSQNLPSGILTITYVNTLRGRLQDDSILHVQAGQILSCPQPGQVTSTTQSTQTSQRTRRASVFAFRTREESEPERERRQSIEQLPIQMISDGVHTPQRRDSSISLMSLNSQRRDSSISLMSIMRRTSTSSIEFDTASVRCSCYYLPNETTDSDDVPPYSETPTGNITICPLHGENPIPPPSYDNNTSSYNSLCRILGLPEYDEVVITKPVILSTMLKDITENSQNDILSTSTLTTTTMRRPMDSSNRTCPLSDRLSNSQVIFETIFEDRSERSDSFLSEYNVQGLDAEAAPTTSVAATTEVTLPTAPTTSATVTTTEAASLFTEPSASAVGITTEVTLPTAPTTSVAAITTEVTLPTAPTTSVVATTEEAAADGTHDVTTTTAVTFTEQITFSTSKQTA